jgi:hypothetical protein
MKETYTLKTNTHWKILEKLINKLRGYGHKNVSEMSKDITKNQNSVPVVTWTLLFITALQYMTYKSSSMVLGSVFWSKYGCNHHGKVLRCTSRQTEAATVSKLRVNLSKGTLFPLLLTR